MTTANNPENQNSKAAQGSSQINDYRIDFPQWVIVENAGQDNEDIWADFYSFRAAIEELREIGGQENGFDLMKRLNDGTLTTEY